MKFVSIYTLSDSSGIRYVGKTNNIHRRKRAHINEAKQNRLNNHRINWIKSLLNKNEQPIIDILDVVPENEWIFWEIYWISQMKSWGFNLVNGTNGGENPPSWKGKTHSIEYRKRRCEIMLLNNPAKNMNDNWKRKISESNKGRILSKEHIRNLGKPIIQLDLNGNFIERWESITNASKTLNIIYSGISLCVRGKRNKSGGFKWIFDEKQ